MYAYPEKLKQMIYFFIFFYEDNIENKTCQNSYFIPTAPISKAPLILHHMA